MTTETRAISEILTDLDEAQSGEKAQPKKVGALRRELEEAVRDGEAPVPNPTYAVQIDDPAPAGMVSECSLVSDVIARFAAEARADKKPRFLYNAIRRGIKTMRVVRAAAGLPPDAHPLDLPSWGELGLDDKGSPIEKKPEPKPAPSVPFESPEAKAKREAQEKALSGKDDESQMDKAKRVAQALAAAGDPAWSTSSEGMRELASAGIKASPTAPVKGV